MFEFDPYKTPGQRVIEKSVKVGGKDINLEKVILAKIRLFAFNQIGHHWSSYFFLLEIYTLYQRIFKSWKRWL